MSYKLITEQNDNVEIITETNEFGKKNFYIEGPFIQTEIANRNGRLYERAMMEGVVDKYVESSVKNNRAFGELNHPCHGPSAEVLTKTGWKLIKNLSINEEIYTLNLETNKVETNHVEKVHINKYTGNMLKIHNRSFNTMVTPYHKMVVEYRNGEKYFITAQDIKESLDNNVSKLSKFCVPRTGEFGECSPKTITIGEHTIDYKVFCGFLGLYLAEGHCTKRKNRPNSYIIGITQNDGEKANKIRELLNKTPWKWREQKSINKFSNNCCIQFITHDLSLAEYLFKLGKCHEKYIPSDILINLDSISSKELMKYYHLGDGRGKLEEKFSPTDIFTTSKKLADDLSVVVAIAGYGFSMHTEITEEDVIIENRIIKAGRKRPLHFVSILSTQGAWLDKRHIKIEEIPYDDDVYCLTVKNHTFMVRDNGYCFWSGNCGPTINLDRVCILIKELKWDKNDVYGKARVTDTPMGNTVKGILESGGQLGVSTRGMGELEKRSDGLMIVKPGYYLATAADVVSDPSAPGAFVKGIMEGVEYFYDAITNTWKEEAVEEIKKEIHKMSKSQREENALRLFEEYIKTIS